MTEIDLNRMVRKDIESLESVWYKRGSYIRITVNGHLAGWRRCKDGSMVPYGLDEFQKLEAAYVNSVSIYEL